MNSLKSILFVCILLFSGSTLSNGDAILLAKIVGQGAAQLKELKEILEMNNATFDQIERANRKVQQARYRIVRARNLLDSAQSLSHSNVERTQDALNYMKKAKSLGKNSKSLYEDVNSLSPNERERVLQQLDALNSEAKTLEQKIEEKKLNLFSNKVNEQRLLGHESETVKYEPLSEINESTAASDIDPSTAQVETAKNTSITNRLLLQSASVHSENLREMYKLNNRLDEEDLKKLQEEEAKKKFWRIK